MADILLQSWERMDIFMCNVRDIEASVSYVIRCFTAASDRFQLALHYRNSDEAADNTDDNTDKRNAAEAAEEALKRMIVNRRFVVADVSRIGDKLRGAVSKGSECRVIVPAAQIRRDLLSQSVELLL